MGLTIVNERPIAPSSRIARLPIYFGWVVLVMAAFAMTATLPGRTHGLGLITKPLTDDPTLGVSEGSFSILNFWAVLLGTAICLPTGYFIDRLGVRLVLVIVALALGGAVLWMSQAAGIVVLFVTLTLIRGFGQGALSVVSMAMVGKWFTRRLGIAMAFFTVLLSIGFIASTVGVGEAAKYFSWRDVWAGVGLTLLLVLAPLGWLLVRSTPESVGLPADSTRAETEPSSPLNVSLGEALSSPAFWAFTLGAALFNLVWSAITLFQESLLAERNFNHDTFVMVMGMLVAAGLPANLLAGWLIPRWGLGRLLLIGMILLAGSLIAFPHLTTEGEAMAYGIALGISGGIVTVIFFALCGHAFGRTHLGAIQATMQVITVVASALGPVLLTHCKVWFGSHRPFFYGCAPVAVVLGIVAWCSPLPDKNQRVA
jgi:MFS family permease